MTPLDPTGPPAAADPMVPPVAALFDRVASGYDGAALRLFPFCADRLVAQLALRPGEKLLDVATGTGAVATSAAQVLRPGGRVTGVDIAAGMLARAAVNARRLGVDNVDLHCMDGAALEFRSGYFDALSCSFGLFFMPDMAQALKEWRRVLRPGGRLLFTSFGAGAFSPLRERLMAGLKEHGAVFPDRPLWEPADGPGAAGDTTAPAWLQLTDPVRVAALLERAGFTDISVIEEPMGYHLQGPEEWWDVVWNSGFRGQVECLPAGALEAFRAEHLAALADLVTADGLWLELPVLFVAARRPA